MKYAFQVDKSAIDIWSIPHFFSGMLVGIPALYYGYSFYEGLAIVIILSLGVECVEFFLAIKESRANQVADLILGIGAFLLGYILFYSLESEPVKYIMSFSLLISLLVAVPGSFRYIKRGKNASQSGEPKE